MFRVDATLKIREPCGISSEILEEANTSSPELNPLANVASRPRAQTRSRNRHLGGVGFESVAMLVAPYLILVRGEGLTESGISCADAIRNTRLAVEKLAVFVQTQGACGGPIREGRLLDSPNGVCAARVVEVMMDHRTPFGTRQPVAETGSSPAVVSNIFNFLEPDEIMIKENRTEGSFRWTGKRLQADAQTAEDRVWEGG